MKRILVVHFSQTGQLARIVRRLLSPFAGATDVEVIEEVLRPRSPYPFPWPLLRFFDAMPEAVLLDPPALEPLAVRADERFDLVVLAYQVWFLAPSSPVTAFLKSDEGRRLLRGRPVVTVIGCRNMWLNAQETVKQLIQDAGGELRDNVVFTDRAPTLATLITTPRWLLTGRRDGFLGLPPAGIAEADIAGAERFGHALVHALRDGREKGSAPMLAGLGAARVDPRLIFSERAGKRAFGVWSRIIRLGGKPGSLLRLPLVALFCLYLVAMILAVVPASLLLQRLLRPLLARRLESQKTYFEAPSGP
ncbi:MAG TPA: dialkylresorcinol condensing enzyme [Burkholderiales bacterium]|nr:dialkylresorcinol condensing enzyme [Burkholderiales bacterium]